jgi:hypothetical protein
VRAHEALGNRQPEAGPAGRARACAVASPEPLEHSLRGARRQSDARVLDGDEHVIVVRLDDDRNGTIARRVAQRVREQVEQHALDLVRRHPNRGAARVHARLQPDVAAAGLGVDRSQARRDQVSERRFPPFEREHTRVDQGELEEGADERGDRRGNRQGEHLSVVMHPEHHPPGRENEHERQRRGQQRKRRYLESQRRQQPRGERRGDAGGENREADQDGSRRHARIL